MGDGIRNSITESGWIFPWHLWESLPEYQKQFAGLQFSGRKTLDYYKETLQVLSFFNMDAVLDAGCGMGQWTIPLAMLNKEVHALDVYMPRVQIGHALAALYEQPNCNFYQSSVERLHFSAESFDGVFCCEVIMFTNIVNSLSEFYRVLKPGGRVYFNVNTYGWYLHMLIDRGLRKRNMKQITAASKMIFNAIKGEKGNMLVDKRWLIGQLRSVGFNIVAMDIEGHLNLSKETSRPLSVYPSYFYGFPSILEVIAEKPR